MSLIVSGIRLPFEVSPAQAVQEALQRCGLQAGEVQAAVYRQSIDARRGKITKVYSICITGVPEETAFVERLGRADVRCKCTEAVSLTRGSQVLQHRPIVIGAGPAGLFAAYCLSEYGYAPIVLERGDAIAQRDTAVNQFFSGGALDLQSNIQFGEGGAGTYSDGKLTTRINDARCEKVLHTLTAFGAPDAILRQAKPHIGTDILKQVVVKMRQKIIENGGEFHFRTQAEDFILQNGVLQAIRANGQEIPCQVAVTAVGHSARDTFAALQQSGVLLEPKPFSVGARIEHLQTDIDEMLYGKYAGHPALPPAEYTLSHHVGERTCYSFCMCPGGQVVAAQSESDSIVTNGMSYHARDGRNANAAIVVSVSPSDFPTNDPLGGIAFQRQIEHAAYQQTGGYCAPCQTVTDFLADRPSKAYDKVQPTYPIGVVLGTLRGCLPPYIIEAMQVGLRAFGRRMHGFDGQGALLTAPETRTSSPVRIKRGETLMSVQAEGIFPCGEGAGYAGGIMSAAVDGLRIAEQIIQQYAPILE